MKPPSRPQPSPAQQGKEVSETVAPKGKPNQILLPNFHGYVVKHGEIHSEAADATGQALEGGSNARPSAREKICKGGTKISLVGSDASRTKGRGGPLQGSVVWLLSQLFAASPVKASMQING